MTNLIGMAIATFIATTGLAAAQNWNYQQQQIGRFGYTQGSDGQGNTINGTHQQIGRFGYDNYRDNHGNTRNCTSQVIGNYRYTNCN